MGKTPSSGGLVQQHAGWGGAQQLQGKELSYNNLLDLDAAQATVSASPAKARSRGDQTHQPCGVATGRDANDALARAIAADPVSAFGGIVALNQPLDGAACGSLQGLFLECIVAPEITAEAREILSSKSNLRLLELPPAASAAATRQQLRSVLGGVLLQARDQISDDHNAWRVVSQRQPDAEEWLICACLACGAPCAATRSWKPGKASVLAPVR